MTQALPMVSVIVAHERDGSDEPRILGAFYSQRWAEWTKVMICKAQPMMNVYVTRCTIDERPDEGPDDAE